MILLCVLMLVQDIDMHPQKTVATVLPPGARHQIIQSTLAAKWTFRLDTWTGRIFQFAESDKKRVFQELPVSPKPAPGGSARYQIVSSGLAARFTFLLDSTTGRTWILVEDKSGDAVFVELESI